MPTLRKLAPSLVATAFAAIFSSLGPVRAQSADHSPPEAAAAVVERHEGKNELPDVERLGLGEVGLTGDSQTAEPGAREPSPEGQSSLSDSPRMTAIRWFGTLGAVILIMRTLRRR